MEDHKQESRYFGHNSDDEKSTRKENCQCRCEKCKCDEKSCTECHCNCDCDSCTCTKSNNPCCE